MTARAALVSLLLLAGCKFEYGRLAGASSMPIEVVDPDVRDFELAREVEGEDVMEVFFLFPTQAPPTIDRAIEKALAKAEAEALVNVVIEREVWFIPFIYGRSAYRVQGLALRVLHRDPGVADAALPPTPDAPEPGDGKSGSD